MRILFLSLRGAENRKWGPRRYEEAYFGAICSGELRKQLFERVTRMSMQTVLYVPEVYTRGHMNGEV